MTLTTHIIGMLTAMIPNQRSHAIREERLEYLIAEPSPLNLHEEVPFP